MFEFRGEAISLYRLPSHHSRMVGQVEKENDGDEGGPEQQLDHGQDKHEPIKKRCSPHPIGKHAQDRDWLDDHRHQVNAVRIAQVVVVGDPAGLTIYCVINPLVKTPVGGINCPSPRGPPASFSSSSFVKTSLSRLNSISSGDAAVRSVSESPCRKSICLRALRATPMVLPEFCYFFDISRCFSRPDKETKRNQSNRFVHGNIVKRSACKENN